MGTSARCSCSAGFQPAMFSRGDEKQKRRQDAGATRVREADGQRNAKFGARQENPPSNDEGGAPGKSRGRSRSLAAMPDPQRRGRPRNDKLAAEARFTKWDMAQTGECIERRERERHKGRQTNCAKRAGAIFLRED
jgi:hypothetical protein